MWNRDVLAAVNIGCRYLAETLGLDLGPWQHGSDVEATAKSWKEIFEEAGYQVPFFVESVKHW